MKTTTMNITAEVPLVELCDAFHSLTSTEHLLYMLYWQQQINNKEIFVQRYSHTDHGTLAWVDVACEETVAYYSHYRFKPMPTIVALDFQDQLVGTIAVKYLGSDEESRHLILDQYDNVVNFNEDWCTYDELRELYCRLDGTKFEKEAL